MVIEQIVEIPQSHRLTITVPDEIPTGTHKMIIQFPQSEDTDNSGGFEAEQRQWLNEIVEKVQLETNYILNLIKTKHKL